MNDHQSETLAEGLRLLRISVADESRKHVEKMSSKELDTFLRIRLMGAILKPGLNMAAEIIFMAQCVAIVTNLPPSTSTETILENVLTKEEEETN